MQLLPISQNGIEAYTGPRPSCEPYSPVVTSTVLILNAVGPHGQNKLPQVVQGSLIRNVVYSQFTGRMQRHKYVVCTGREGLSY